MRVFKGRAVDAAVCRLESRGRMGLREIEPKVRRIISQVRQNGDVALRRYAVRWDGLGMNDDMAVPEGEIKRAWDEASPQLRTALATAAGNIRRFCEWQKPCEWRRETGPGLFIGQVVRPLRSAGCYVPGGRYPLPSTLLMTVIPAQVAGVARIAVVSPKPARETLAAAAMLGIREFYRIGGAHAIAALAYGSESVAAVEKIVGPGSLYVTAAKKLVAFDCPIDMLAGPTELVILANSGQPDFIAADLVAQAEHDPDAVGLLVTTSATLARCVSREVARRSRKNRTARVSLARHGAILLVRSAEEATALVNRIAPEHLILARNHLAAVQNAGCVFLGEWSPPAAGDYVVGPNHVLPTGGTARVRGGLSVLDFVKLVSLQELSPSGLSSLAPAITTLAEAEGLRAHSDSVRVRCGDA